MLCPLIRQFPPFGIIFGRIRLPRRRVHPLIHWRMPRIILRMSRERLRHETKLYVRLDTMFKIRVKNAVIDGPVINGFPVRIFLVRTGGAPFQRIRPVTARKQMMTPEIDLRRTKPSQFAEQLLSILQVRIIRFVRAKKTPDGCEFAQRLRRLHFNRHRKRRVREGCIPSRFTPTDRSNDQCRK